MLLTEYNEAEAMELFKEDGRKEGRREGRKEGRREGFIEALRLLVNSGKISAKEASSFAEISEEALLNPQTEPEIQP